MTVPSNPSAPTLTPGPASLLVTWTAPAASPAITGYFVRYRDSPAGTFTAIFVGLVLSYNLASLLPGVAQDVGVRAQNADGNSGYSASTTATPLAAASATKSFFYDS